jgi:hypothetical protein
VFFGLLTKTSGFERVIKKVESALKKKGKRKKKKKKKREEKLGGFLLFDLSLFISPFN